MLDQNKIEQIREYGLSEEEIAEFSSNLTEREIMLILHINFLEVRLMEAYETLEQVASLEGASAETRADEDDPMLAMAKELAEKHLVQTAPKRNIGDLDE